MPVVAVAGDKAGEERGVEEAEVVEPAVVVPVLLLPEGCVCVGWWVGG